MKHLDTTCLDPTYLIQYDKSAQKFLIQRIKSLGTSIIYSPMGPGLKKVELNVTTLSGYKKKFVLIGKIVFI